MKYKYTSPEIVVEELVKNDILCTSGPDNIQSQVNNLSGLWWGSTLADFSDKL